MRRLKQSDNSSGTSDAVLGRPYQDLPAAERSVFTARFEHKVSDHMPL